MKDHKRIPDTLAGELHDLADFMARNTDKDGNMAPVNLTFIYRRLIAITGRAELERDVLRRALKSAFKRYR